jgi:hypothetical protein
MRVVMNSVEEFAEEIAEEHAGVLGGIVRQRVDREPEQPEAVTHRVWVWLTAVIATEHGNYLLEFGGTAGSDDNRTPSGGSDHAREWINCIAEVCSRHRLDLRPGKLEVA